MIVMTFSWWKWHHFNLDTKNIEEKLQILNLLFIILPRNGSFKIKKSRIPHPNYGLKIEISSQNLEKISSFLLYCLIYSRKFPKILMKTKWPAEILLLFFNQTFFKCQNIQRYLMQNESFKMTHYKISTIWVMRLSHTYASF